MILLVPLLIGAILFGGREVIRRRRSFEWRRLGVVIGGAAAVCGLGALLFGFEQGPNGPAAVLAGTAAIGGGVAVAALRRDPRAADGQWAARADRAGSIAGPRRPGPASTRAVARALARVEARELWRSPWFAIGIGFCALGLALFGFAWVADDSVTWDGQLQLSPWLALPLVGMVVLAMHRSATRAPRDGADELLDTCPTDPQTRTAGLLLAAALPMAALAAYLVGLGFAVAVSAEEVYGSIGIDAVADVLGAVLLGAGGVALGVALGRWVRFGLAPIVAVVAVGFLSIQLNMFGGRGWNPLRHLSTAPSVDEMEPMFADRPTHWHLVWVLGLTSLVAVFALARHRRDRTIAVAAAASVVVALVAAIGTTRPLPAASAAGIADRVASPENAQQCTAASRVEVCVFPLYEPLLIPIRERVAPIAAALPAEVRPITLRQVFPEQFDDLPPEVRRRLDPGDLRRPEDEIPLGFDHDAIEISGGDLALTAVGLPVEADDMHRPTVVAGEARGVVALWLASRGLDAEAAAEAATSPGVDSPNTFDRGALDEVEGCSVPAVVWSAQDLAAARAVIAMPDGDVRRVIGDEWGRWTDPATGTDELLAAVGLDPVGPFDRFEARPGEPC